jgi:hypothetical protein
MHSPSLQITRVKLNVLSKGACSLVQRSIDDMKIGKDV